MALHVVCANAATLLTLAPTPTDSQYPPQVWLELNMVRLPYVEDDTDLEIAVNSLL